MTREQFVKVAEGVFRDPDLECFSVRLGRWIRYKQAEAEKQEGIEQK